MQSKYRSLLVPLDGSDLAEHALPMALSIARRHDAAIHLVRIYVPVAGVEGEYAVPYDEALDRELTRQAHVYLDDVVARLTRVAGIRPTAALREGPIADAISRHAEAIGADLLVMTTQGRGPLGRFWFGSVSDELVRQGGIPILLVRPQPTVPDFAQEPTIRNLLIPLDGSALSERIIEPALALWDTAEAEYSLLQIVRPTTELNYGPAGGSITGFRESLKQLQEREQQELKRAHEYLEQLAMRLRTQTRNVHTRVAVSERPANAILDDASAHGADLIALATRGRGGLKRLVLGSVADKLLRGAETPVLVYRPPDESAVANQ